MRVAIYTLGCKVNQYETQAMEAELTRRGHALVPFDGAADAYVINTSRRTSAAGPPPCPTCAPTSTSPCRAAATPR